MMPLAFSGAGKPLSAEGFDAAAESLGVDAAKLWAVFEIESKRCGFISDRRPVILFERHKFHERTNGRFSDSHPDISNKDAGGYGLAGSHQFDRLAKAIELDREAALWSTSWGLGQVMGFNAVAAGFRDCEDLVQRMRASEDAQLRGMVKFLLSNGLHKPLQTGNWSSFARGYNGSKYHINKYDDRLRGAYNKYATGPLPDFAVRSAQLWLQYLGFSPGLVDGWAGDDTMRALNAYRTHHGRSEVDHVSDADLELLSASVAQL